MWQFKLLKILFFINYFYCKSYALSISTVAEGSISTVHLDKSYIEQEQLLLKSLAEKLNGNLNKDSSPCEDYLSYIDKNIENSDFLILNPEFDQDQKTEIVKHYLKGIDDISRNGDDKIDGVEQQYTFAERKAIGFYNSCIFNSNNSFKDSLKSIEENLKEITEWPAFSSNWNGNEFQWNEVEGNLQHHGINVFLKVKFEKYATNKIYYVSAIKYSKEDPTNEDINEIFTLYGLKDEEIQVMKNNLIKFENNLKEVNFDESKSYVNIDWLSEHLPGINWKEYLEIISGSEVDPASEIVLNNEKTIKEYIEIINKSDNKEIIVNYLFYKLHQRFLNDHRALQLDKNNCYSRVFDNFPTIVLNLILKNSINDHDEKNHLLVINNFLLLWEEIKANNSKNIDRIKYADQIIDSFRKIKDVIGNKRGHDQDVNKLYETLDLSDTNYFKNFIITQHFNRINIYKSPFYSLLGTDTVAGIIYRTAGQPRICSEAMYGFGGYAMILTEAGYKHELTGNDDSFCEVFSNYYGVIKGTEYGLKLVNYFRGYGNEEPTFNDEMKTLMEFDLNQTRIYYNLLAKELIKMFKGEKKIHEIPYGNTKLFILRQLVSTYDIGEEYKCPLNSALNKEIKCSY